MYLCHTITVYLDDNISNKELGLPLKSADSTIIETFSVKEK